LTNTSSKHSVNGPSGSPPELELAAGSPEDDESGGSPVVLADPLLLDVLVLAGMVVATIVVPPSDPLDPSVPEPPTPSSTVHPAIIKPMQPTRANMEPRYANGLVAEREKGTLTEAKAPFAEGRRYAALRDP
jgi:hypothetical protein